MVVRALVLIFFMLAGTVTHANEGCTARSEYEPALCPLDLPKIDKVVVKEDARRASSATKLEPACDSFVMNEKIVYRFLRSAKKNSADDARQVLDWSPCSASGEIYFIDGTKGIWSVDQYRGGRILIKDKDEINLYCPTCRFKPFHW